MKKMVIIGWLLGVIFMQGCGLYKHSMPTFTNIKDVDAHLEQVRLNAKDKSEVVGLGVWGSDVDMQKGAISAIITLPLMFLNPVSVLDKAMAGVYALTAATKATTLVQSGVYLSGYIDFARRIEVSRSVPGVPERDIIADGFKKIPPMTNCLPVTIDPSYPMKAVYEGKDGRVTSAKSVRVEFHYAGIIDEATKKSKCDLEEVKEYFKAGMIGIRDTVNDTLPPEIKALPDQSDIKNLSDPEYRVRYCYTYFCNPAKEKAKAEKQAAKDKVAAAEREEMQRYYAAKRAAREKAAKEQQNAEKHDEPVSEQVK